jgi:predicted Ser/Thr protein kinase
MPDDEHSGPEAETSPGGVESQLRLARVLKQLLGDAATPTAPPRIGRYRITRTLGRGAMGVVYAGHDEALDREVGIKVLQSSIARSDAARRRFIREAQAMARLSHPHIAHVYEVGEHDGQVYIAMELVSGQTLREWQSERARGAREILGVHLQAARGLAAAHEAGIVHRDFKPDNVMVDARGRARVMDFGLARHTDDATLEQTAPEAAAALADSGRQSSPGDLTTVGTVMGTPAYMAPEQLLGERVDHRADQFSFCVALFEALYGRRPFAGVTMAELRAAIRKQEFARAEAPPDLPRGIDAPLRRGLAFEAADRHDSMDALVAAIEAEQGRRGRAWFAIAIAAIGGATAVAVALREPSVAAPPPVAPQGAAAVAPEDAPAAAAVVDPWAEILAGSQLPELMPEPIAGDPAKVTVHRLRNGLTVYLVPTANAALVHTVVAVRADATDESARQAGVAELLPHVLDGSDRLGSTDPAAEAPVLARFHAALAALEGERSDEERRAALAAAVQAAADAQPFEIVGEASGLAAELGILEEPQPDGVGTSFAYSVPRNRLAAWAAMSAELLTRPAFRDVLGTVSYRVEDNREAADDALAVEAARGIGEATGWTLGPDARLRSQVTVPFAPMRDFWRDYYRPNNAAIVLVGEVTATEVLPILEAAFGHWEPAPIPPRRVVLPVVGRRSTVTDDGPPQVTFAWPRRDGLHRLDAVEHLLHESQFVARWLARDGRARQVPHNLWPSVLSFSVTPNPGSSLDDAEAAAHALLETLARGGLAPEEVRIAQRELELDVATLGASTEDLAILLADAFTRRVPWREHPASRSELVLSAEDISAAARDLLRDAPIVVRRDTGANARLDLPPFDLPEPSAPRVEVEGASAFAAALRDAPVSPLEPQFIVRGEAFTEHSLGPGRVIAVTEPTGLLEVRWILPRGVADDPWICDAWRMRLAALAEGPSFAGTDATTVCTATATAIDLGLAAPRRESLWPILEALRTPEFDGAAALVDLAALRQRREGLRASGDRRRAAFWAASLHGEHGVDAHLPSDAALERATPARLRAALVDSLALVPDVLVVGPAAKAVATELVTRTPVTAAKTRDPRPIPPRSLTQTTIFVMDDPDARLAEVSVAQAVDVRDPEARVLSELLGDDMTTRFLEADIEIEHWSPIKPPTLDARSVFRPEGVACAAKDVPQLLTELLEGRRRPLTLPEYEQAHGLLDGRLRARRRFGLDAAAYVWSWRKLGAVQADPALDEWMALRGLDFETASRRQQAIAAAPTIVAVSADLRELDVAALARIGRVVHVTPQALRDPEVSDRDVSYLPVAR